MTTAATLHDPELESLPEPRRPWRRLTLGVMALTAVVCSGLIFGLLGPAIYATVTSGPTQLGDLTGVQLGPSLDNRWVQGRGTLERSALEYRRPLDSDRFRLAQVAGRTDLWVEVRVPSDLAIEHYVPPTSFVGRLVPLSGAGLAYAGIPRAVERTLEKSVPADAWILLDGEAPRSSRWAIAVAALLFSFVVFSVWGMIRLLRPVRDR